MGAADFRSLCLRLACTLSSPPLTALAPQAAKDYGCEGGTVDFFLPLGTTVNMNGTALYEATTAIFIAQVPEMVLSHSFSLADASHLSASPLPGLRRSFNSGLKNCPAAATTAGSWRGSIPR